MVNSTLSDFITKIIVIFIVVIIKRELFTQRESLGSVIRECTSVEQRYDYANAVQVLRYVACA